MRYTASEKLEIIGIVAQSHLSVSRTLEQIGISRATLYRWYDLYQTGGPDALEDRSSKPGLQVLRGYPQSLLLRLEQSHRPAVEDHVNRDPRMGPSVMINEKWY